MDDIKKDPFEEYIRQTEPSKKELGYAWYTAMGLQAVDGLETSEHLKGIARDNIDGKITLPEANKLIETYYEKSAERDIVRFKKRRKNKSYMGEITPAVENLIKRDFHADHPNEKWLTDITEFHIPAGKIYLSPIIDCFDGLPVSWTIGTSPDAELANTMLDGAIRLLRQDEHPIVHSDRGCHYRWPGWIERMNTAGLTRSMSKKGCSPDNSA